MLDQVLAPAVDLISLDSQGKVDRTCSAMRRHISALVRLEWIEDQEHAVSDREDKMPPLFLTNLAEPQYTLIKQLCLRQIININSRLHNMIDRGHVLFYSFDIALSKPQFEFAVPVRFAIFCGLMAKSGRSDLGVHLALFYVVSIWGVNFVIMKMTFDLIEPFAFNGVRFILAFAILFSVLLIKEGWQPIPLRDAIRLILLGLFGNTIFQYFIMTGLDLTRPENTALIQATIPVWSALIAWLLRWERIPWRVWIGIILSFSGVAMIVYATSGEFSLDQLGVRGDLLVLGSALSWAIYTVFSKDLLLRYSPLRVSTLALAGGLLPILIYSYPAVAATDWSDLSFWVWASIASSGSLAIALNYIIWSFAVQRVGAARTAIYNNVTPIITFVSAFLLLNQPIFVLQLAGGAVILAGVWLTIKTK